jgi:hypothetical protein
LDLASSQNGVSRQMNRNFCMFKDFYYAASQSKLQHLMNTWSGLWEDSSIQRQRGVKTTNAGVGWLGTSRVKSTRILKDLVVAQRKWAEVHVILQMI